MSETLRDFKPFPGLRPFEIEEYDVFFGREGQSDELLARLGRTHFLAVVGTSGSGKSSLVRAGLLPALRGGMLARKGSAWRIAVMRPGGDPVGNLALALAEEGVLEEAGGGLRGVEAEAVIEATLRRGALGLVEAARQARLGPRDNLLVVVDQFEELFRFRDRLDAEDTGPAAFVKLLLEASQQREVPVYVVLTMRSDFLGDCSRFQGLPEAINEAQFLVPRMNRDERRMAITGPVAVAGESMSEPLVNRLLNDVGDNPDQLPILQHALMRTWEHWAARASNGEPVGLEDYEAVGTMDNALSRHAEEAYAELGEEGQEQSSRQRVAEVLFKSLTERGSDNREVRRPTRFSQLCAAADASPEEVEAVIDVFRRPGRSFLMPPQEEDVELAPGTVIDISHESLIRIWERLAKWVDEEAESARTYERIVNLALTNTHLTGSFLDTALEWRAKHRPNAAWAERYQQKFGSEMDFDRASAFLDESRDRRDAAARAEEDRIAAERERERLKLEQAQKLAESESLRAAAEAERAESERRRADAERRELEKAAALADRERKLKEAELIRAEEQAAAQQRELEQARVRAEEQTRAASRLRRLIYALVLISVLMFAAAGTAVYAYAQAKSSEAKAKESESRAKESEKRAVVKEGEAKDAQAKAEGLSRDLETKVDELTKAKKATDDANVLKEKALVAANEQKEIAETEARRANEQERIAKDEATKEARTAASLRKEIQFTEDSRAASASLRRGELDSAQSQLAKLAVDFRDDSPKSTWINSNIGAAWSRQGNDVKSEEYYSLAKGVYEQMINVKRFADGKKYARSDIEYLDILNGLAQLYDDFGKYDKAEPLYKNALDINEAALGKEHPEVASSLEALAANYQSQGKSDDAEPLYERALEIRRKRPESLELDETLNKAADFYADTGKPHKALELYKQLLAAQDRRFPSGDDPRMADTYSNLARAYRDAEPSAWAGVADKLDELAKQIRSRNRDSDYYKKLAKMYIGLRKYPQAEPLVFEAERLYKPADMASASEAAAPYIEFAELHRQAGSFKTAVDSYNQVIDDIPLGDDPVRRRAFEGLASLYYDRDRYDDALKLYERAVVMYPPEGERDDDDRLAAATTLVRLALTHLAKGDSDAGERRLNDALREASAGRPADCAGDASRPMASPCNRSYAFGIIVNTYLADYYRKQGKMNEAGALYKKVLGVAAEKFGGGGDSAADADGDDDSDGPVRLRPRVLSYIVRSQPEILRAFVEAARFSVKRQDDAAAEQFYYMAVATTFQKQESARFDYVTARPVIAAFNEYAELLKRTGRADSAESKRRGAERLKSIMESNENPLP